MTAGIAMMLLWHAGNLDAQLPSLALVELMPVRELDTFGLTVFPALDMNLLFGNADIMNGEGIIAIIMKMLVSHALVS